MLQDCDRRFDLRNLYLRIGALIRFVTDWLGSLLVVVFAVLMPQLISYVASAVAGATHSSTPPADPEGFRRCCACDEVPHLRLHSLCLCGAGLGSAIGGFVAGVGQALGATVGSLIGNAAGTLVVQTFAFVGQASFATSTCETSPAPRRSQPTPVPP